MIFFISARACYLREKIAAILEKNNVRIICPCVRAYSPVRHVLMKKYPLKGAST